jgi:hypothetical protein
LEAGKLGSARDRLVGAERPDKDAQEGLLKPFLVFSTLPK